jgi:hypothetical protein
MYICAGIEVQTEEGRGGFSSWSGLGGCAPFITLPKDSLFKPAHTNIECGHQRRFPLLFDVNSKHTLMSCYLLLQLYVRPIPKPVLLLITFLIRNY